MKFKFIGLNNINERTLKRITHKYILRNGGRDVFKRSRNWIMTIRGSDRASENPFFEGDGTGGVTGIASPRGAIL